MGARSNPGSSPVFRSDYPTNNAYASLIVAGLLVASLGTAGAVGAFGTFLSVAAAAPPTVDCSNYPALGCTIGAQISNTGGFVAPFTAYFVYKNSAGQTVLIDHAQVNVAQGSTVPVTDIFPSTAGGGALAFSVSVFVWDATGAPAGGAQTATFSVPVSFIIDYGGVGSVTVSPPGQGATQCTSACSGTIFGGSWYRAYWPAGTTLTVTTSAGVAPVGIVGDLQSCPASGSGFVCTVKVTQFGSVVITGVTGSASSAPVIFVSEGQTGVATPNPISICLSSTTQTLTGGIQCSPSGSFMLNVISGYTWKGNLWQVSSGSTAVAQGNSTSVSLTYAQLSPSANFVNGQATMLLSTAVGIPVSVPCSGTECPPPPGSQCVLNPNSNAGVNVLVLGNAGQPVSGALVTGAGASAVTDSSGHAILCNFPVPSGNLVNNQGQITVDVGASGYASASQSVNVIEGQTTSAIVQLQSSGVFGFSVWYAVIVAGAVMAFFGVVLEARDDE